MGVGPPTIFNKMIHKGRGSWQLLKRLCCLQKAALWGPPFVMLFSSCFLLSPGCVCLGFVWAWQVLDGSKCTTQMCLFAEKTLCWEKSAWGVLGSFSSVYVVLKMTTCHVSGWHRYAILAYKRTAICCRSSCKWFLQDHLQLAISHFWAFNVAKLCQRNSRDNGP